MKLTTTKKRNGDVRIVAEMTTREAIVVRDALEIISPDDEKERDISILGEHQFSDAIQDALDMVYGKARDDSFQYEKAVE